MYTLRKLHKNFLCIKVEVENIFFFNSLASRYSNEEFGHSDCMEGEIFEQAAGLVHFFQGLVGGRRRRRYDFYDMPVSNTKANVNISLSGARLTGLASTDFKMLMDRTIRGEPQDAKVDLIVKIDDFTVKVIQN